MEVNYLYFQIYQKPYLIVMIQLTIKIYFCYLQKSNFNTFLINPRIIKYIMLYYKSINFGM